MVLLDTEVRGHSMRMALKTKVSTVKFNLHLLEDNVLRERYTCFS